MAIFSGIVAAITAVSGWIGGLSALSAFALKTAVGIGVSLAAQKLAGKGKVGDQKFSINTGLAGGGALARSFILGKAPTGGSLVWANTWGKSDGAKNAWLTQVIAVSDIPVKGLLEVWVDGVKVTYDLSKNNDTIYGQSIPEYEKKGPNLYVKFYDGTQTVADPTLVSTDSTSDRNWASDRIGRGVAYVIVRARSTKGLFSGVPSFTFLIDGARLYDPSKDSTNGGVGPQRWLDRSTWGGDGDDFPVVQIYNLMRGISYNNRWIYGFQNMSAARLPATNWVAQINKCRRPILESGGLQPTYRAAGEIEVSAALSVALDELLTSCQGKIAEAGGFYTIYVGEPDAPLFSIVDGDIVSTEEQEFTPFYGLADAINGISGSYPEPIDGYAERTAPPMYRPDLEALDGNRRLMADVQFSFVPYSEQVQRLMKSALLASLRYRRHTITLPPKFWRYAVPGETLRWTSTRNGYIDKLFVIDGVVDKANLDVTVDITEYDPADYDWQSSTEFKPPVTGSLGPITPVPRSIIDPYAEPYTLTDAQTKARRPAIRVVWDNGVDNLIGVVGIQWEIRLAGTTVVQLTGNTADTERGSAIVSAGILSNTQYEVRLRYIPQEGEDDALWSGWFPVLTPTVLLGAGDIEAALETIAEDAKAVWREIGGQLDEVWKRVEHLAQASTLDGAVGTVERTEIKAAVGQNSASIVEEREVRVTETEALARRSSLIEANVSSNTARIQNEEVARASADSAFATRLSQIGVTVEGNSAAILSESTARVNGDAALAETIEAVRAQFGEGLAEGMVTFQAVASPAGVTARYALLIRATQGAQFQQTGFYVEIYNDGGTLRSRTVFDTQQFVITSSDGRNQSVFAFDANGAMLSVANIGTVTAGVINIGKTRIDTNGITVSS